MSTPSKERLQQVFEVGHCATADAAARASSRRFVRGRMQISPFEPQRTGLGHVVNAFEAYAAYGFELLEEAVEYGSAPLLRHPNGVGRALRRQREELGLAYRRLAPRTGVSEHDLERIEKGQADDVPMRKLERVAFALGLDEAQLAFHPGSGGAAVAARLRTLRHQSPDLRLPALNARSVATFAEAASVIRVQHRLQNWLATGGDAHEFHPNDDYGNQVTPAWRVGYELAERTRDCLGLGVAPIRKLRELVEVRLGIPVVQAELPVAVAGATIAVSDAGESPCRGVVLNTTGDNENPLVRRATLAHELGHLLFDEDQVLTAVRVVSYASLEQDAQVPSAADVEQRTNAFAVNLLAPVAAVRARSAVPVTATHVLDTVQRFGISVTAASFHVANAHWRVEPPLHVDEVAYDTQPWRAAEDFGLDYFPIPGTSNVRRGRFAGLVAAAWKRSLHSTASAASYLECDEAVFRSHADAILDLHPVG